jgi:hypothetical protein
MDTKHFEILLRPTWFCRKLLVEIWNDLNTSERIDLMLHFGSLPAELKEKALNDSNPVIRMLAAKACDISESSDPELYEKLKADKSPFVRATLYTKGLFPDSFEYELDALIKLSHVERLGAIALSDFISGKPFAKFICEGLQNQSFSEKEAAQLVIEFVRNPKLNRGMERESLDGMHWHTRKGNFDAIWNLTTCTTPKVHLIIALEYPLKFGFSNTIPEEMFERMSKESLRQLVWRGHKPLLKLIEENPEQFDEEINNAAQDFAEIEDKLERQEPSEVDELSMELKEFRDEVNNRLDTIANQIAQLLSRRRGLFG